MRGARLGSSRTTFRFAFRLASCVVFSFGVVGNIFVWFVCFRPILPVNKEVGFSCDHSAARVIFACIRLCVRTGFCSPDPADFNDHHGNYLTKSQPVQTVS